MLTIRRNTRQAGSTHACNVNYNMACTHNPKKQKRTHRDDGTTILGLSSENVEKHTEENRKKKKATRCLVEKSKKYVSATRTAPILLSFFAGFSL